MQWQNKDIAKLDNDELWAAIQSVAEIYNFRFDKLKDPRITTHNHRLNKIFTANPPVESEAFTNLCDALNNEFKLRNKELKNG